MHQCDFDSLARTMCDAIDILQENLHFVIKNEINEKVFKYQSTIASLEYFLGKNKKEEDVQVNLYNFSLVNSDWNEVSNSFLWLNPNLSSTKDLSKLVYCSVLSGIRMQQQNAKFDKSEFSSMQTNPTSIDKLSLSGPIISKKQLKNSEACTADDAEYLEVVQQGLARLTHLEILDFEDDITDSTESPTKVCSPSSFLPTPTESMGNFKVPSSNKQTINEEIYFGSKTSKGKSVSLDQLSGKSLTSNSKVKKLANEKLKEINKIISISPTLIQPSAVQPETNLSGEKQIVRDLPRLLKKSFVGVLEHLSLSGNSTSDLVVSIVRLSNGLKHALLNDCNNLTDRAAILLAANCGFTLTKISFKNCNLISDESIYEIRQYCHKLQYLDLTRTSITDKALEILADDLGEEDNNWEGLKGLYLEQTSICSDGGVKLGQYIKSFGCKLVDLNLLNCNFSLSKSESEAIFNTFNSFSDFSNFERFDCRNTFNLSSDYNGTRNSKVGKTSVSSNLVTKNGNGLEDEITKFVLNFVNLNTFNLGVLGVETTPFIEELYVKFPNEDEEKQDTQSILSKTDSSSNLTTSTKESKANSLNSHTFNANSIKNKLLGEKQSKFLNKLTLNQTIQATGPITCVKFSFDGLYLAIASQDGILSIWHINNSTSANEIYFNNPYLVFTGHKDAIIDITWSRNNFIASSSLDKTVRLWHVKEPECLCSFIHRDAVASVRFHPFDDRYLLTGSLDSRLRIWAIHEKKVLYWNELPNNGYITAVSFTHDGSMVVVGTFNGDCIFYEFEELKYNTQISIHSNSNKKSKITAIEPILNDANNLGGEKSLLLISSNDSKLRVYSLRDKSLVCKYKGADTKNTQLRGCVDDDGKFIFCGGSDSCVHAWLIDCKNNSGVLNNIRAEANVKHSVEKFQAVEDQAILTCVQIAPKILREQVNEMQNIAPPMKDYSRSITSESSADMYKADLEGAILAVGDNYGRVLIYENVEKRLNLNFQNINFSSSLSPNSINFSPSYRNGNLSADQVSIQLSPTVLNYTPVKEVFPQNKNNTGIKSGLKKSSSINTFENRSSVSAAPERKNNRVSTLPINYRIPPMGSSSGQKKSLEGIGETHFLARTSDRSRVASAPLPNKTGYLRPSTPNKNTRK
ncbi:WD repeat-containing protein 44 [Lobulomyces angularis]|nr:WD repeat-containing protein 44 [Lobulomyces angularis]